MTSEGLPPLVDRVRVLEASLFADQLDPADVMRMKSDQYSWLYRPSHHIETGLVTEEDINALQNGKRLLSVGACPAHLERLLIELGIASENIIIADSNPDILTIDTPIQKELFDCTKKWPDLGLFDIIIFPESLCIALTDAIKQEDISDHTGSFPTDAREAELLAHIMKEALSRLQPGGVIRANGPQSHPNVWKRAGAMLEQSGYPYVLEYQRYFISVRHH